MRTDRQDDGEIFFYMEQYLTQESPQENIVKNIIRYNYILHYSFLYFHNQ